MNLFNQDLQPVTVLSYGGGQDSTAILMMLIFNEEFRQRYAPGRLLVLMADTGDEHPETYSYLTFIQSLCAMYQIEFHFIKPEMGFHPKTWWSLRAWMEKYDGLFSKAFPKSCTDNLKIKPVYNFLEDWLSRNYDTRKGSKKALRDYFKSYGKLRMLLGIAAGEDGRLSGNSTGPLWMQRHVDRVYPLNDLNMDRQACQDVIEQYGYEIPRPSNCMLCPWMSKQELMYLYRFHPAHYHYWVIREQAKIDKVKTKSPEKRNVGVWGRQKLLPQILEEAIAEFGHWTDDQLREYKMSHGHCVQSKF